MTTISQIYWIYIFLSRHETNFHMLHQMVMWRKQMTSNQASFARTRSSKVDTYSVPECIRYHTSKSADIQYRTLHAADLMLLNPCMVHESLCMQIGFTTANSHHWLIISMQCINHAAKPVQCSAARSVSGCRQALTGGWRAGARNCSWQARPSRALPLARGWEEACDGRQMTWAWFIFDYATNRRD